MVRSHIRNCLVASNQCAGNNYGGGGIYCNNSNYFENCTIVMNHSVIKNGGGINFSTDTSSVANTIIDLNSAPGRLGVAYNLSWNNPLVYFTNCSLQLRANVENQYSVTNADCLFGLDNRFANANALDFQLLRGSPCVDAGFNQLEWMEETVDLSGNLRVFNGIVDIGAYERFYPGGAVLTVY